MNHVRQINGMDRDRRGAILVLAAIFMTVMLAFVAFAVDMSYMSLTKTQLQAAADASALAGALELSATDDPATVRTNALVRIHAMPSALCVGLVVWGPPGRWPMAYSKEFRGGVLAACDANEGTQAVALRFKVSESWVRRVKQQRRETGQIAAKTTRHRQPIWQGWAEWLQAKIAARPDIYLRELQAALKTERGHTVCLQTLCNACRVLEQTRKKRL